MNLKKFGKVFTSKFVGTGPSFYKKNNLSSRGLAKVEKHCCRVRVSEHDNNHRVKKRGKMPVYAKCKRNVKKK